MYHVHVTNLPDEHRRLDCLRAVREAMNILRGDDGQPVTIREADEQVTNALGLSIGSTESYETAAHVVEALRANGVEAEVRGDDEREQRRAQTERDRLAGLAPEQVFARGVGDAQQPQLAALPTIVPPASEPPERPVYSSQAYDTALAILAHASGDPLKACAWAHTLGRTSEDPDLYGEAALALLGVFPWIEGALRQSGLYPESS